MRTKILYHNLSVPGETLCFGRKLVPEGGGLALILSDETDLREEQAEEKLAQAGIVITLAGSLGWEEARRLCIMGEGGRSLESLSLPEQMREKSALAAVWFYLSMREEPGSGEELMDLHNGLLALLGAEEENAQLAAALGEKGTRAFYNAMITRQFAGSFCKTGNPDLNVIHKFQETAYDHHDTGGDRHFLRRHRTVTERDTGNRGL